MRPLIMLTLNIDGNIELELKTRAEKAKKSVEQLVKEMILDCLADKHYAARHNEQIDRLGRTENSDINRHAGKLHLAQDPLVISTRYTE